MSNPAFMSVIFEGQRKELACAHLSAYIAKPVAANWEALYAAAEQWNDDNPDADWPINVKRFEVISNEELWDAYL